MFIEDERALWRMAQRGEAAVDRIPGEGRRHAHGGVRDRWRWTRRRLPGWKWRRSRRSDERSRRLTSAPGVKLLRRTARRRMRAQSTSGAAPHGTAAGAARRRPCCHRACTTSSTSNTRHYTTLMHDRTVTAHETASAAHVSRQLFAKTVMLKVDGTLAMMVMPAAYRVDLTRLSRALGGRDGGARRRNRIQGRVPRLRSRRDAAVRQSLRHAGVRRFAPGVAARRSRSTPARTPMRCACRMRSSSGWRSPSCCGWRT